MKPKTHSLKPHFDIDFGAAVWQLRIDAAAAMLAVEVRDADLLQARFQVLDLNSGSRVLQDWQGPSPWRIGLEALTGGVLLLHQYDRQGLGQRQGILAADARTGAMLWQQPELTFYKVEQGAVLAEQTTQPEHGLLELDLLHGKPLRQLRENRWNRQAAATAEQEAVRMPAEHPEGSVYFPVLQQFLFGKVQKQAVQLIHYLETPQHLMLDFYVPEAAGTLANFLSVFSAEGELQLLECLATGCPAPGADNLFVFDEKLFFIKDRNWILSYYL